MNDKPDISIIVPTRKRPDRARKMLDSIARTARHPDRLEIIFITDDDDDSYDGFEYTALPLKRIVVPHGMTMGGLNMAGYRVSRGAHVLLLNDDVVAGTAGWDEIVLAAFRTFDDGIVLIHCNDHLFESKLCTFPFMTRDMCERIGGISHEGYRRYRIDDHIYNIFNLLSVLGFNRILYLPEVVFEHHNFTTSETGHAEYQPDPAIHAIDTRLFDALFEERKQIAVELARYMDARRDRERALTRANILAPLTDSVSLRKPEYVRFWSEQTQVTSETARVTIGIVTANIHSPLAEACLASVKRFTHNFEIVVIDNNRDRDFNHAREMNRIISACRTDYLVLMDDDVAVEAGWLDGMLRCVGPKTGIVTPLHKTVDGQVSYAGVVMSPDYSGNHTHALELFRTAFPIQTMCSAIFLIDMRKCGHLRVDESYSKYFLDIDYGLRVWEAGYETICCPHVLVTHIGGATLAQGSHLSNQLFEEQRLHFARVWLETGRYKALESSPAWRESAPIAAILDAPDRLKRMLAPPGADKMQFLEDAHAFFEWLNHYPALVQWARDLLFSIADQRPPNFTLNDHWWEAALIGQLDCPVLMEVDHRNRFNVVLWNGRYFAMPPDAGQFDATLASSGGYGHLLQASRLSVLRTLINADANRKSCPVKPVAATPMPEIALTPPREPRLVEEGYRGYNIIAWGDRFYALPQTEGAFDPQRIVDDRYPNGMDAALVAELKLLIESHTEAAARSGLSSSLLRKVAQLGRSKVRLLKPRPAPSRFALAGDASPQKQAAERDSIRESRQDKTARDSRRWLAASPPVLLVEDYRGWAIHRFEFKYFATRLDGASLLETMLKEKRYDGCLIAHSLIELQRLIDRSHDEATTDRRTLVLGVLPADEMAPYLDTLDPASADVLLPASCDPAPCDFTTIPADAADLTEWARAVASGRHAGAVARLTAANYGKVVLPWHFPETWRDNSLEVMAAKLSDYVEVRMAVGVQRLFSGETLHRLFYNKAYLCSMFEVVPQPTGKAVLEVGCSDGMVCEIFALLGARKVVGIDVMETVGCGHAHAAVEYRSMEAGTLDLPDESFDIVYSIATLEHVPNPAAVLNEIVRVLKPGGHAYVQAGPLYHSPFGHHMFGYFRDEPWIHLRRSKAEILAYAREHGIGEEIERDFGIGLEAYLDEMLNFDHVNGLFLEEYGLDSFQQRGDIEVLKFNHSYEGEDLLKPDILRETDPVGRERLIEHGFEIAFRRRR